MRKLLSIILSVVTLTGCTQTMLQAEQSVERRGRDAQRLMETARAPETQTRASTVRYSNSVWLGEKSFRGYNGEPLPERFGFITFATGQPLSIEEIGSGITQITGLPVTVGGIVQAEDDEELDAYLANPTSIEPENRMRVNYSGSLAKLLDVVGSRFDYSWEYRDGTIYFLKYITRTFALNALPFDTTSSAALNASSTSDLAGSSQQIQSEATIELWDEINSAIETMLPEDSRVSMSRTTGTITVSTSRWAMRKIEEYIQQQNKLINRQVAINVQVLSVRTNEDDVFNFDLNLAFQSMNGDFNFDFDGPSQAFDSALTGLGAVSGGIISGGDNEALGQWAGSGAALDALSRLGKTSLLSTASVTTINNQPVPVQVVERRDYVSEIEQSVDEGVVSTSVTTDTITSGFVLNLLPRIMADGEITLQYAFSLSTLDELQEVTFEGNQVQLPIISTRDFLQNVRIDSGDTLVLAGFQRNLDSSDQSGTGRPSWWGLGGGHAASRQKETIVILIQPVLLR